MTKKVSEMTLEELYEKYFRYDSKKEEMVPIKYDNSLKTFQEREQYMFTVIEAMGIFEMTPSKLDYDKWGSYLLQSKDVLSNRKISDTFYINMSEAYKHKEYKGAYLVDLENRHDIQYGNGADPKELPNKEYLNRLFNYGEMEYKEKRRLLRNFTNVNGDISLVVKNQIDFILEDILLSVKDNTDIKIIEYLTLGLTENQMSEKLGISRQAINKRIIRVLG